MRSDAEIDHLQAIRGENISQRLRMIRTDRRKQPHFVFPMIFGFLICSWIPVAMSQQLPVEPLPSPTSNTQDLREESRSVELTDSQTLVALSQHWKSYRLIDTIGKPVRLPPSDVSAAMENQLEIGTKPIAFARLRFEPELPADVVVSGKVLATFNGGEIAEWGVGLEGKAARLRVLVTSKPGTDWQFSTRVLLDTSETGSGVTRGLEIQPKTVIEVIKRLQTYDRWLLESSEEWKSLSAAQRGRDAADALSRSRLLGTRQKESERSLRRWLEIEAISKPLFERGYLDLVVQVGERSQKDEAQCTSESADRVEPEEDQPAKVLDSAIDK